jgi:hypothetical protein
MVYAIRMKYLAVILGVALNLSAQTNPPAATNSTAMADPNGPAAQVQKAEQVRADCVQGRRLICGRILKVLPDGLVVESGYTGLLHPPLNKAWLIPGSVVSSRPASLIESREPGSPCVGVVFLNNAPKARGAAPKPKPYDYVVLLGYPAGEYTYTSVGAVQKTVRRFSANLLKAVNLNFEAGEKAGTNAASSVK